MNVETLSMPRATARAALKHYRAGLHRKADAEYEQIALAYRELANGRAMLALSDAFARAPLDAKGRPRLAIGRADRWQVVLRMREGTASFSTTERGGGVGLHIDVPLASAHWASPNGYALVPLVPPNVKKHHALNRHHVLWEVEQWADRRLGERPDRDPYLLRHIGGDLWAVLAEWELTAIERAVMQGRAT